MGYLHWLLWHQTVPRFLRQQLTVIVCLRVCTCVCAHVRRSTCEIARLSGAHMCKACCIWRDGVTQKANQQRLVGRAVAAISPANLSPNDLTDLFMRCKWTYVWRATAQEVNSNWSAPGSQCVCLFLSTLEHVCDYTNLESWGIFLLDTDLPFPLCLHSSRGQCQLGAIPCLFIYLKFTTRPQRESDMDWFVSLNTTWLKKFSCYCLFIYIHNKTQTNKYKEASM